MAMAGSVVTRDMEFNTIYAGVPAQPISAKVGPQFVEVPLSERLKQMEAYAREAGVLEHVIIVADRSSIASTAPKDKTVFCVGSRTYLKRGSQAEIAFMKFLLPERAKFVPVV